jgi:hypothetical protein
MRASTRGSRSLQAAPLTDLVDSKEAVDGTVVRVVSRDRQAWRAALEAAVARLPNGVKRRAGDTGSAGRRSACLARRPQPGRVTARSPHRDDQSAWRPILESTSRPTMPSVVAINSFPPIAVRARTGCRIGISIISRKFSGFQIFTVRSSPPLTSRV